MSSHDLSSIRSSSDYCLSSDAQIHSRCLPLAWCSRRNLASPDYEKIDAYCLTRNSLWRHVLLHLQWPRVFNWLAQHCSSSHYHARVHFSSILQWCRVHCFSKQYTDLDFQLHTSICLNPRLYFHVHFLLQQANYSSFIGSHGSLETQIGGDDAPSHPWIEDTHYD
jgi:hypothetical protein